MHVDEQDDAGDSVMHHTLSLSLSAPEPSAGLPVYSQTGFDMLALIARVATRTTPRIKLGPVDLTCAFVVADARADDAPIIYVSRTFCELTGYAESEVLGRNCRFLQAPGGQVRRGDRRALTSPEAVRDLRFGIAADQEVQVSLVNYRKDGTPFVNRVSIVPVPATDGGRESAFYVGFQVDLNEQPTAIAHRMRDGKFYSPANATYFPALSPAERSAKRVGPTLRRLLTDSRLHASVTLSTSCYHANTALDATGPAANTTASTTTNSTSNSLRPDARDAHQWLHLLLLEHAPDIVHVLSLKGFFLYASPAAARVLGYEQSELVGRCVGELCHPNDAVPLQRELKESSSSVVPVPPVASATAMRAGAGTSTSTSGLDPNADAAATHHEPRAVDLLFRLRTKEGNFVWMECDGRLHTEPGKGRKAIVLFGRRRAAPGVLRWGEIEGAGGVLDSVRASTAVAAARVGGGSEDERDSEDEDELEGPDNEREHEHEQEHEREREFWSVLSTEGLFLVASVGVRDVLGLGAGEVLGRSLREFVDVDAVMGERTRTAPNNPRPAAGYTQTDTPTSTPTSQRTDSDSSAKPRTPSSDSHPSTLSPAPATAALSLSTSVAAVAAEVVAARARAARADAHAHPPPAQRPQL